MKDIAELIKNFNKKRYRRIINKNKYSFKIDPYVVSIFNYTAIAYGLIAKNHTTKKSILYYIPFPDIYYLKELIWDEYLLNYMIRKVMFDAKNENRWKCLKIF